MILNEVEKELLRQRILSVVDKIPDGCWVFKKTKLRLGPERRSRYASFFFNGRVKLAHHWSIIAFDRAFPKSGQVVDHTCGNRYCVNIEHLENVSQKENARRYFHQRQKCIKGHGLSGENLKTYSNKPNLRICKICQNINQKTSDRNKLFRNRLKKSLSIIHKHNL
jgi:hypothetical protein